MKESDAIVDYKEHQLFLYVEKNSGSYEPVQTGSFFTKTYVEDFWEKQKNKEETLFKMLTEKQISPVGYYMRMIDISDAEVAARAGISIRKVRNHKTNVFFRKISVSLLEKYAVIFGIQIADLFQIRVASDSKYIAINEKTPNSLVSTLKIVGEKK